MKYDIMSLAHRKAKDLRFYGDKRSYRELLSISLKVRHMMKRIITIHDINWLMNNYNTKYIDLSLLRSFYKTDKFKVSGSIRNHIDLEITHYVRPRTQEEDNKMIGVMIESERRSGRKVNLD